MKRSRLAKYCTEFLLFTLHLRRTENPGHPASLRESVKNALSKLEQKCKEVQLSYQDYQHAKFALVAFLDETVSIPSWQYNDAWKRNPLQFELYQRYDAGEQFFERLAHLRKDPRNNLEALEVYYLCMSLGFKGKYEFVGRDQLAILQDNVYREIQPFLRSEVRQLSPEGYPREALLENVQREIPLWVIFAVAGSIMLLFYLVMSFLMSNSAASVIQSIQ